MGCRSCFRRAAAANARRPDYAVAAALLVTAMMVLLANMSIDLHGLYRQSGRGCGATRGRGGRGHGMLGYLQSAQFSGQVAGPVIGGVIGVHFGLPAVFFVTGALVAACGELAHWAQRRVRA